MKKQKLKIAHICLSGPYTEGWGFQENILPSVESRQGHNVFVIANNTKHLSDGTIVSVCEGEKKLEDGVNLVRVSLKKIFPFYAINKALFVFPIMKILNNIKPDILFLHGLGQGLLNNEIKKYCIKNQECILFGDTHLFSEVDVHKYGIFYKIYSVFNKYKIKSLFPYYKKVYCITPACMDYAIKRFNAPSNKLSLLPLGFDPNFIRWDKRNQIKQAFMVNKNININDIVICHGGKIIPRRNTDLAIKAFVKANIKNAYFVVFGDIEITIKDVIMNLMRDNPRIIYLGHLSRESYIKVFLSSDLGFFPGGQSALWQEAIGCGLPLLVGEAANIQYLNFGGNLRYTSRDAVDKMAADLKKIIKSNQYMKMKKIATSDKRNFFSYERIADVITDDYFMEKNKHGRA